MPAPKMTMSWTLVRFLNNIVLARAVRNAVSSSALTRARGVPSRSNNVSEPLGEVPDLFGLSGSKVSLSGGVSKAVVDDRLDPIDD